MINDLLVAALSLAVLAFAGYVGRLLDRFEDLEDAQEATNILARTVRADCIAIRNEARLRPYPHDLS